MQIYPGFRAFVELLNAHKVEYLIIGAHALAFHGRPRYTNDRPHDIGLGFGF